MSEQVIKKEREEIKYLIWPGKDTVVTTGTEQQRTSDFQGICYACGVLYHSQSFCPLRFCRRCKQYGHTSRVCPDVNDNPPTMRPSVNGNRYYHRK